MKKVYEKLSKMPIKEIHHQRFIEIVEKIYNKVWTINSLLNKINFLLPSNIEMNKDSLRLLISKQQHFRVFKYGTQQRKGTKRKHKTYYIFKRYLPR